MATRTWRGATDNNWRVPGNWAENAVPTCADDVVFDDLSPSCQLAASGECCNVKMHLDFPGVLDSHGFGVCYCGSCQEGL